MHPFRWAVSTVAIGAYTDMAYRPPRAGSAPAPRRPVAALPTGEDTAEEFDVP